MAQSIFFILQSIAPLFWHLAWYAEALTSVGKSQAIFVVDDVSYRMFSFATTRVTQFQELDLGFPVKLQECISFFAPESITFKSNNSNLKFS